MPTLEEEFQKPVRDRLAEIVIPDGELPAWDMPDLLGVNQWYLEAQEFQDAQVVAYEKAIDDILDGHGSISGQFPSPVKRRRRTRARSKK